MADFMALIHWVSFIPSQIHNLMLIFVLFGLLEITGRKRWHDAVAAYQLGHMAGRIDQQQEFEIVSAHPRQLPHTLHQDLTRARGRAAAGNGGDVLHLPRRYDRA
jgi:hypothetical protein